MIFATGGTRLTALAASAIMEGTGIEPVWGRVYNHPRHQLAPRLRGSSNLDPRLIGLTAHRRPGCKLRRRWALAFHGTINIDCQAGAEGHDGPHRFEVTW